MSNKNNNNDKTTKKNTKSKKNKKNIRKDYEEMMKYNTHSGDVAALKKDFINLVTSLPDNDFLELMDFFIFCSEEFFNDFNSDVLDEMDYFEDIDDEDEAFLDEMLTKGYYNDPDDNIIYLNNLHYNNNNDDDLPF